MLNYYVIFTVIRNLICFGKILFRGDKTGKVKAIGVQRKSTDWALSLKINTGGG